MNIEVRIPSGVGDFAASAAAVVVDGESAKEVIDNLGMMFEGLRGELLDDMDQINPMIRIYVNNEDIRYLDGLNTVVHEGDIITILPVISG